MASSTPRCVWNSLGFVLAHAATIVAAEPQFSQLTIDQNPPEKPYYKMVGDISGDGLADIIVAGARGPMVAYLAPEWTKQQIAERGWDGVNGELGDIDADGDLDIVMGGTAWFRNPGKRGSWQRIAIDDQKAHDIELADLDGNGRLDVVARDQSAFGKNGNWIVIYYQLGDDRWQKVKLECPHGEGLKVGDIDRDEDADILIGGRWYANPGNLESRWQPFTFTTAWTEPDTQVELADFNGDGQPDIVLTPAELKDENYRVSWYQAPADPRQGNWKEHVIVKSIECVIHSLGVGDLDGDGDMDVAIAEMHQGEDPDEVSVHFNQGRGVAWQSQVLSGAGSHDIVVADLEADGDLDIVGANHAGVHPLEVWRNDLMTP